MDPESAQDSIEEVHTYSGAAVAQKAPWEQEY